MKSRRGLVKVKKKKHGCLQHNHTWSLCSAKVEAKVSKQPKKSKTDNAVAKYLAVFFLKQPKKQFLFTKKVATVAIATLTKIGIHSAWFFLLTIYQ